MHRPGRNAAQFFGIVVVGHDALGLSALWQVAAEGVQTSAAAHNMPRAGHSRKARSRNWTIANQAASVHSGGALLFRGEMPTSGTMPEPRRFPPPWSVEIKKR
jgi:hypothetical protein